MAASPERARSVSAKTKQLLDRFALEVRRTLKKPSADQVHDLRVASRRLGQMVAVRDSAGNGAGKIRRTLKQTIAHAGAVRDYDIAAKLIAKLRAPARVESRFGRRRAEAERELTTYLRNLSGIRFSDKWSAKLTVKNGVVDAAERQMLLRAAQRLFDRAAKIDASPRALHKLRIAAKKLRYTMELLHFSPARLDPIKQLQSKLGDINDYESTRRLAAKEGASKNLIKGLQQAQEKKTRQFRRYWKREFEGKEQRWMALLTHPRAASSTTD
jgi:CHAD domain-containing protein